MTLKSSANSFFNYLKFKQLTPIQEMVYPKAMANKDIIVQSATGTGKTHAFLFPILDKVNHESNSLQSLIVVPTRELAMQVYQFACEMKHIVPQLNIKLLVGGKDRKKMQEKVEQTVHIAIGTPGRVSDLIKHGSLRVDQVNCFVVDEADMIWEYGFMDEVIDIFSRLNKKCQMMAFSATIFDQLIAVLKKSMNQPLILENKQESLFNPNIEHNLIDISGKNEIDVINTILSQQQVAGCIIFANTRQKAGEVSHALAQLGLNPLELHGDLTPRKRKQTVLRLTDQQHPLLVATDIAARGLDLPYVSTVISIGLPTHIEFYFHRAGRTGRSGKQGSVYVLVNKENKQQVEYIASTGISFNFLKVSQNKLTNARNFYAKKVFHQKVDPEILAITSRKTAKVKPNYKKKRKAEVDKIVKTKRRNMIREEIKKQKKERAKARSKQFNSL